jgi:twitching motility protein PilT
MDAPQPREPEINKLFRMARKHEASHLYLHAGSPPSLRLRGVTRTADMRPLTQADLERLLSPILYSEQQEFLGQGKDIAFSYAFEEGDVYHVKVANENGQLSVSAHRVGNTGGTGE